MKIISYIIKILSKLAIPFVIYMAFFKKDAGAANLLKLIVWVFFLLNLILFIVTSKLTFLAHKYAGYKPILKSTITAKINLSLACIYACIMAYFGWIGYGFLTFLVGILGYLLSIIDINAIKNRLDEINKEV